MFIDHLGVIFFPNVKILRIIGRIAFPIFAFMIAEGCRYTKNKLRYLLTVMTMGIAYMVAFYLYSGTVYMSIFITFTLSIMMIYALQAFKNACIDKSASLARRIACGVAFFASLAFSYLLSEIFTLDYGFVGALTPLLASAVHKPDGNSNGIFNRIDRIEFSVLGVAVGIIGLYAVYGNIRIYALLSLPLLLLYSGRRGKHKMKYFFYIFYPAHMLVLEGAHMLIKVLKG